MKKLVYLLTMILVLASCKKKDEKVFEASDVTANASISGIIKYNNNDALMSGVQVKVKVANAELYNNNADGFTYFTATSDANGRYTVNFKVNKLNGSDIELIIPGFSRTSDELAESGTEGVYEFEEYTDTWGTVEEGETIVEDLWLDYDRFRADYVGTVTFAGNLWIMDTDRVDFTDPMNPVYVQTDTNIFANQTFDFYYYENNTQKFMSITSDANGAFSFEIPVTENGLDMGSMYGEKQPFMGSFYAVDDATGANFFTAEGIWGNNQIYLGLNNTNYPYMDLMAGQNLTFDLIITPAAVTFDTNSY